MKRTRELLTLTLTLGFLFLMAVQSFRTNSNLRSYNWPTRFAEVFSAKVLLTNSNSNSRIHSSHTRIRHLSARAQATNENIEPTSYVYDLYQVLGIGSNASKTEIKEAYWRISAQSHPDRNNVKLIILAHAVVYDIIVTKYLNSMYDRLPRHYPFSEMPHMPIPYSARIRAPEANMMPSTEPPSILVCLNRYPPLYNGIFLYS